MSANDGWRYQGRQQHGWFGTGTKPQDAVNAAKASRGMAAGARASRFGGNYRWTGAWRASARQDDATTRYGSFAPLQLPSADMGPVASARARRRLDFVATELLRAEYASALGHLLFGQPFPVNVDDPKPEPLHEQDFLDSPGNVFHTENEETSRRPPPGSKGIDETRWSGDHLTIKKATDAGNDTNVKISPADEVWVENQDGSWTNKGPAEDYTASGRASGRRGKDRERNRRDQK